MRLGGPAEYLSKLPGASGQAILSATSDGEETSSYQVELSRLDEDWDVRAERVSAPNMPSLIRVGQEVTSWLPGSSAPLVAGPDQGMALATVPPSYANGEARAFLQNLGRFAIYQAVTNILRGVSPDPSKAEPIGLSGGGLPEAVEDMLIDPSEAGLPETHASLSDLLGWAAEAKVMDRTELSMSSSLHTGARVLAFRDHHLREGQQLISAYDASEGALYLLFLSVLARHPAVPALFALEHPDAAMHPRLGRRVLGDFFRTLVQSPRPRQVFLTTHSPLVLDCLPEDGDDYRLFAVDRSPRGVTVIRPVPFREALKRGAARGYPRPLSELWLTGALGGVPSL
jgi:hypothetical protein